jgi:predicted GNAT family N-acyltransferase
MRAIGDNECSIRAFGVNDRIDCLHVFDSNVPYFFAVGERPEFATFLETIPCPYLVVVDADNVVVGCGGFDVDRSTGSASLCWGMIRRDLHGQGLGTLLLTERLHRLRERDDVKRLVLDTSQRTTAFYAKHGFETVVVSPDAFGPGLDGVRMIWRKSFPGREPGLRAILHPILPHPGAEGGVWSE